MTERSWVQIPTVETIFHALGPKSMGAKIDWKIPGIVAYAVILQKGGWTWRTVGLSSFITKDEMKSLSANQDQTPRKKNILKKPFRNKTKDHQIIKSI